MKNGQVEIKKINELKVVNIYNNSNIMFLGIAVIAGSNFETPEVAGISHFTEHMFFKGTKTKTWKDISESLALMGCDQNAYTDNTEVLYHCNFPKHNLEKAVPLMMDMFFNSTFPENEIKKERNVILEEIKMYKDNPSSFFYNTISNKMFIWDKGHAILGKPSTLKSIQSSDLTDYLSKHCNLGNIAFVCCGNVKTDKLLNYIKRSFPKNHKYLHHGTINLKDSNLWNEKFILKTQNKKIKLIVKRKNIVQSQISLIMSVVNTINKMWWPQQILMKYIGGGSYSRLFTRIREELGLCYSIGSRIITVAYPNCSIANTYGDTSPKNVNTFIEECEKEFQKILKNGLDKKVFECAKTALIVQTFRETETSTGMAHYLLLPCLFDINNDLEDIIKKIQKVTIDDCNLIAQEIFQGKWANWAVMNPA